MLSGYTDHAFKLPIYRHGKQLDQLRGRAGRQGDPGGWRGLTTKAFVKVAVRP
ncbi:hypothetical protein AB0A95_29635 [Micromonospora sp. NPDC049230]|uniref:hypothetical protein n=1 Tax=Micromonospora sp. NPDC049230 TaxID=3155502 RepID=UPI00340F1BE5